MKRGLKIIAVNLVLMFVIITVIENVIAESPYILSNVVWQCKDLGGMTMNTAASYMEKTIDGILAKPITFSLNGNTYSYNGYELGYMADTKKMAEKAWLWGRHGVFWQRWRERGSFEVLKTDWVWHKNAAVKILNDLAKNNYREALPAEARLINGEIKITAAQNGSFVDIYPVLMMLEKDYNQNPAMIEIPFYKVLPYPSTENIQYWGWQNICATCTTYYNTNSLNRSYNLGKAANVLNSLIIYSGAVISFNDLTGEKSAAMGYKKAPIIVDGKLTDDYGGGVCQVASTLYSAVLQGGDAFKVIERYPHSLSVNYLPKGMDATVSYGYKDLVFQYLGKSPLLLTVTAQNGVLRVEFRGISK